MAFFRSLFTPPSAVGRFMPPVPNSSRKDRNARDAYALCRFGATFAASVFVLPVLAVLLSGCLGGNDLQEAKPTTGRAPQVAELPDADETVRGETDPPIVTLKLGSKLREKRITRGEDLPGNIIIPTTNLNAVPVTAALQAVLTGTDVSLSWETGVFDARLVTVTNLSGALPRVVEKICASARLFCLYRNGTLELKEKETFIVDLPSMPTKASGGGSSATNSMTDTIADLVGDKVRIDAQGGNLIYTADVEGHAKVKEYLDQLRNGRPLVVFQIHIWEVKLDKNSATGINWSNLNFDKMGNIGQSLLLSGWSSGFNSLKETAGVNLGGTLTGSVATSAVLSFLSKHGQVQTISNPQITMVSGGEAEFRVGGEQRYISNVGQLTSSASSGAVSGSNASSAGIGSNTVSTDSIKKGLTLNVSGVFENGIVSAALEMDITDVVDLGKTTTGGVTINLPETTERKINTTVRVRPGDNLLMAGMVSSSDTNKREGIPSPFSQDLSMFKSDDVQNRELVMLIRPSVVLFSDAGQENDTSGTKAQEQSDLPLPDAVVIDKDGARTLTLPHVQPMPTAISGYARYDSALPESMMRQETAPYPPSASSPSTIYAQPSYVLSQDPNAALVDRSLMQRGFSHALGDPPSAGGAK